MEKKNFRGTETEDILTLLSEARAGSEQAMNQLLDIFSPQMEKQTRILRMPKEDAMQSLKLGLIIFIRNYNSDIEH